MTALFIFVIIVALALLALAARHPARAAAQDERWMFDAAAVTQTPTEVPSGHQPSLVIPSPRSAPR